MTSRSNRDPVPALIGWLVLGGAAFAQIEVRSPSAKLLDTNPGRIVTASVVVENRGGEGEDFNERFTLPPGCLRVAPPDLPFHLEAGAQAVRILAVQIPATMPAGRYDLRYMVQGRRDPSLLRSIDLSVLVLPVDSLELVVESHPEPVIAGDNYPVHVRVTNYGNRRLPVELSWRSSLNYRVTGGARGLVLEAGATRELLYRVETSKELAQRNSHVLTFEAKSASAPGKPLVEMRASVIDVIPITSGNRDPFHRIPMQLKLSVLFETDRDLQFQAELSGAGTLDEAGRHKVDFLFRGPDVENVGFFGERDEYGLSYHGDKWDVSLGDRIYELSPLTERHAFGRGASVAYHTGRTTAGAFYMTTRHRQTNTEEAGAFVRQQLGAFSVQGSFLRKWGGSELFSARALPQNIVSFETRYQRGKELDLRLEYGLSRADSGKSDFGFRAEARGILFGKVDYAIEHLHAGPDFHGYESDTRSTYGSVSVPVTKQARFRATVNAYAGNLALNPERSSVVNRENSWSAGVNYNLRKRTDLSLDAQHVDRTDVLLPAAYDFSEDSIRLGAGHNFGKLQTQSFVDLGTLDNRLTGESGPFQRYSGFVTYQPTGRQSYSIFGTYGPSAYTGSTETSLNAGFSGQWELKERLTANLSYARNQFDNLLGTEQDQAMAAVHYRTPRKDEISIVGRWMRTSGRERDEAAVMVSFARPLSVAVSRKTSIGGLTGRLTEDGVGVPRAVIQAGEAFAVSDSAGEFEFPALKPGGCELRVIADSLGPSLVVATPLPMKVKIRSAGTTRVELKAVKASTLSVRLTVYDFADNSLATTAVKAGRGLDAGTVELTDGRDVLRAQTDRLGEVSFERVPSGRWTLRVHDDQIPAHHVVEQPEQALELKPGESRKLEVRIMPRRRTIQMIDRGTVR